MKLAYADRDTYYGDPKFNQIPREILLSKDYATERRSLISAKASMDFTPGKINGKTGRHHGGICGCTHGNLPLSSSEGDILAQGGRAGKPPAPSMLDSCAKSEYLDAQSPDHLRRRPA